MSVINEVISRVLNVRSMVAADLPRLLQIEKHPGGNGWIRHDLPSAPPGSDRSIWVATIHNHVVGYLDYQLVPESDAEDSELGVGGPRGVWAKKTLSPAKLKVDVLHLMVSPDWRRRGIGRALVERFDPKLTHQRHCLVQAAVPECNLPMQLLLRAANYKAVRILRGYYDEEDGYLMERLRS